MELFDAIQESWRLFFAATSALEWIGVLSGILCVWLASKNNILSWPIACVSVVVYIYIFFHAKLYADAGLQVYFLVMNIYGWYFWSRSKDNRTEQPITGIKPIELIVSLMGIALFTWLLGTLLFTHTDASFPFLDSFLTASSLIAQAWLARRILYNWVIWIIVDIIYIYVYFSKELYATGIMYALYIFIAISGYYSWRKIYHEQKG